MRAMRYIPTLTSHDATPYPILSRTPYTLPLYPLSPLPSPSVPLLIFSCFTAYKTTLECKGGWRFVAWSVGRSAGRTMTALHNRRSRFVGVCARSLAFVRSYNPSRTRPQARNAGWLYSAHQYSWVPGSAGTTSNTKNF